MVLNSLAGKHQELGVQILRPGGRFLEIGKNDIYQNSKIGLYALRMNCLFVCIDMDTMNRTHPDLTTDITKKVFDHLHRGEFHPVPFTVLPMDRIEEGLEVMKAGKHMGKVVLSNYVDGCPISVKARLPQRTFQPGSCYIVTGGTGGFGSRMVRYVFRNGARHFIITVTKDPERVAALFGDLIDTPGCTFETVKADISKEEEVMRVISLAKSKPWPLKGIFHAAGVSIDCLVSDLTNKSNFLQVGGCKALGAWYFHKHTLDMDLEAFVVISSIASLVGGRGRAAYAGANGFLDALIRMRQSMGLPGTAFNMGSLSDVGMLATDMKVRKIQLKTNVEFGQASLAIRDLEDAMVCGIPVASQMFFREQAKGVYPNKVIIMHAKRIPPLRLRSFYVHSYSAICEQ